MRRECHRLSFVGSVDEDAGLDPQLAPICLRLWPSMLRQIGAR
jgi:hypothetical protein